MSAQHWFSLSDQLTTSITRFQRSLLRFLSNLRVKSYITKIIEDDIFMGRICKFK